MMKHLRGAVLALVMVGAPLYAQGGSNAQAVPPQLTLEQAIEIALRNNVQYLTQLNNPDIAEASRRFSFSRLLPTPSASISTGGGSSRSTSPTGTNSGSNSNTSLGVGLGLTVWDRGASITNYRTSKLDVQTSHLDVANQDIVLRTNVINQYYSTQQAERQVTLEKEILIKRRQELEDLLVRFRVARASPLDEEQAKQAIKDQEIAIRNAEGALVKAKLSLLEQLGVMGSTDFTLTTPLPTFDTAVSLSVDSILPLAYAGNVGLKRQTIALERTTMQVKQQKSARYWPSVRLNADYSRGIGQSNYSALFDPTGRNTSLRGSLSVSFGLNEFIDLPAYSRQSRQLDATLYEADLNMRQARLSVERQVRAAVLDVELAYGALAHAQDRVRHARFTVEVADEELRAGAKSYQDYQRIVDNAANSERALLNAQLSVLRTRLALDQLLGKRPGG